MNTLTLFLLSLLVLERIVYYFSITNTRDLKIVWKSFWYWIRFWKPIQKWIWSTYPEINRELYVKWRKEAFQTIITDENRDDSYYHVYDNPEHKPIKDRTPEENKFIAKKKIIYDQIKEYEFNKELEYLKTNHPKYYWIRKLKII